MARRLCCYNRFWLLWEWGQARVHNQLRPVLAPCGMGAGAGAGCAVTTGSGLCGNVKWCAVQIVLLRPVLGSGVNGWQVQVQAVLLQPVLPMPEWAGAGSTVLLQPVLTRCGNGCRRGLRLCCYNRFYPMREWGQARALLLQPVLAPARSSAGAGCAANRFWLRTE